MARALSFVALMLVLVAGSVRAQGTAAAAPDLTKVNQEISDAQEDVTLLRILGTIKLSNAQLARLLPTLDLVQTQLKAQDAKDAATLKAQQAGLETARKQVLAGQQAMTRAEDSYRLALQAIQTGRAKLRANLVATIRKALAGILTQEQLTAMVAAGQEIQFMQMQMNWQAQAQSGQGGGPLRGITQAMDRLRDVPPAEWEQAKSQFGRMFQGGNRGGGGGPGGGGGGGGAFGGGGGQAGGQADAARQQAMQARAQMFTQLAEQIRGMPADQYTNQKYQLAGKMMQQMRQGFGPQEDPDQALQRFIERYLMSPRITIVIRDKTRTGGA